MDNLSKRVVVCAGGTGGHVIPALVLVEMLKSQGHIVKLITDRRGYQYSNNYPLKDTIILKISMTSQGFLNRLIFFYQIFTSCVKSLLYLNNFKPSVIIGFGGYPSLPTLMAARIFNIPIFIHEQNAVLGRTNKFFKNKAHQIFKSFPFTKGLNGEKKQLVGMPLRIKNARRGLHYERGKVLTITIFGGSQGAKFLGALIPQALQLLPYQLYSNISIIHQVRAEELEEVKAKYPPKIQLRIQSYFNDMEDILNESHLVIARAGASTVFETIAFLIPVIFIPLPSAMDNHQFENAEQFRRKGGNWIMPQVCLTPQKIANFITCVLKHPHRLLPTQLRLKDLQQINVAEDLARKIFHV